MQYDYDLRIALVRIRISASRQITLPENFLPFLSDWDGEPDVRVRVFFGTADLSEYPPERTFFITQGASGGDIVRIEPEEPGGLWQLGVPWNMADSVCGSGNWLLYLPLERLLLPYSRLVLHASAVVYQGRAYVFTAPSGTGKSTQADIWHRELGARIINGDKVILSVEHGAVTAHGGPAAGSSGIYRNISAPVAAICCLKQSPRNRLESANNSRGYIQLYSGMVKSHSDPSFNQKLLPQIEAIIENVPVVTLFCTPDRRAAECVLQWMSEGPRIGEKRGKRNVFKQIP